jgi:hypothetical protein
MVVLVAAAVFVTSVPDQENGFVVVVTFCQFVVTPLAGTGFG